MNAEHKSVAFNDLPIELVGVVVSEVVSIGDLLRFRAVNHTIWEFATPRAFSTFHVVNTPGSTQGLQEVLNSARLAPLVKHLAVHCEAGPGENRLLNRDEEDGESKVVRKALSRGLSRLYKLPSLTKLDVQFFSGMVWQSFTNGEDGSMAVTKPSKYFMLQTSIVRALTTPEPGFTAPVLSSLTMHNLIPFPSPEFSSDAFETMLSNVQHLSYTVHGLRFTARRGEDMWSWFWSEMLPERLLEPAQSSLTSLKLMSDQPIGHFPTVDLSWLRFPRLTTLTISGFMFSEQCLMEDFIVHHAPSLRTLTLDTCPIHIGGTDGAPLRPWSVVYQRFGDRLTQMLQFRTLCRTGWGLHEQDSRTEFDSSYERCITGYGYERSKDVKLPFDVLQADRIALRNLLRSVNNRRQVRRLPPFPLPELLIPPPRIRA